MSANIVVLSHLQDHRGNQPYTWGQARTHAYGNGDGTGNVCSDFLFSNSATRVWHASCPHHTPW